MAADVLRQGLLAAPEDARTHALLAMCLSEQEKLEEATEHASAAVHLAPDESYMHYVLSSVLAARRRWKEAQAAIEQAIELDPWDADNFAMLAHTEFAQERWRGALAAAEKGLAIDGEHAACVNLLAMAQVKLGNKAAAAATIDQALARRPDDPYTHANQGWTLLHSGQPRKAMEHFREALRLNPEFEWAQQGIVEALKAHNIIYRWMLAWFLWMGRLPAGARWGIILGGYFGYQFLRRVAAQSPAFAPYIWPILAVYLVFAVMTWLVVPLSNLLLRLHPWGRHALSRDAVSGANLLALTVLLPVPLVLMAWLTGNYTQVLITLCLGLLAIPASAVFSCERGWPRTTAAIAVLALAVLGVIGVAPLHNVLPRPLDGLWQLLSVGAFSLYLPGVVGSQFLMIFLTSARPSR